MFYRRLSWNQIKPLLIVPVDSLVLVLELIIKPHTLFQALYVDLVTEGVLLKGLFCCNLNCILKVTIIQLPLFFKCKE